MQFGKDNLGFIGIFDLKYDSMDEIIFKRKIYEELLSWKTRSKGKKALLIEGARRVGKTTIAQQFAKKEYSSYIYIDFSKGDEQAKDLFEDMSNMDRFYSRLFLHAGHGLKERDGLLILDEVQFAPRARMAVKALCEDGRYDVLETGSLLSLRHRKRPPSTTRMIPSEEQRIQMHPLDFEEFCVAFGDDPSLFDTLRAIAEGSLPLSYINEPVHRKWMEKVRLYVALGGMPAAIAAFMRSNSFYEAHKEKKDIVKLYRDDLSDLDNEMGTCCREVYDGIHEFMNDTGSSRFQINDIFGDGRGNLLPSTLTDIKDSKTVNIVHMALDPSPGLGLSKDRKKFKVYVNDVGLFPALYLEDSGEKEVLDYYRRLIFDRLNANLGSLYEHFVLENLVSKGSSPYYHRFEEKQGSQTKRYEIDFLLYRKGKIVPIEVKSGRSFSISSLKAFKKKYSSRVNDHYVVSPKMPKKEDGITYLPLYLSPFI